MTSTEISLAELWKRGCRNEKLSPAAMKRFAAMARSRFHTFEMGVNHANSLPDEEKVEGLINGLASEMVESPGLLKIWDRMAVSKTGLGDRVNLRLERLTNTLH